jgi:hypothetical protein
MRIEKNALSGLIAGFTAAVCTVILAGPASAVCFRHTFEACPDERSESYSVEVDRKTGRTWLKAPPGDDGLAGLAEDAAANFADGKLVDAKPRTASAPATLSWRARVNSSMTLATARKSSP